MIGPKLRLNCHSTTAKSALSNAIPNHTVTGSSGRSAHRHQLQTSMTASTTAGAASA